jgi:hypothetical protein
MKSYYYNRKRKNGPESVEEESKSAHSGELPDLIDLESELDDGTSQRINNIGSLKSDQERT